MEDLRNSNVQSNSLTLDHASHWRHNPHARLLSLIELANFHHSNLKRKAPQEAINFIEQFLAKTLGSGLFYNVVRQRYAYPGLFESFLELMQEASIKNFPVQHRDLEAVKQLYHSQLTRLIKEAPPTFCHYYQERL
uniref:Predicted protein n=1 Tax=Hordeum vulgare subsp. vulgare TaxID=112509 RepID=F2DSD5_HORVV|nr:predicted protein [Hordeum vulgare subsp. vulgare]